MELRQRHFDSSIDREIVSESFVPILNDAVYHRSQGTIKLNLLKVFIGHCETEVSMNERLLPNDFYEFLHKFMLRICQHFSRQWLLQFNRFRQLEDQIPKFAVHVLKTLAIIHVTLFGNILINLSEDKTINDLLCRWQDRNISIEQFHHHLLFRCVLLFICHGSPIPGQPLRIIGIVHVQFVQILAGHLILTGSGTLRLLGSSHNFK